MEAAVTGFWVPPAQHSTKHVDEVADDGRGDIEEDPGLEDDD